MTAPPDQVVETFWARRKANGAAHFYALSDYGGWATPCGQGRAESKDDLFLEGVETSYRCGRCVQGRERVAVKGQSASPCGLPTCISCNPATEDRMLTWLHAWYAKRTGGNGDRYMFARHVRSHAGFDARTADAVVMDLWVSKGLELHGIEVKISRSDWLNELRDQDKWRPVGQYMDRWWVAISDRTFIRPGELPDSWGLLEVNAAGVQIVRRAPRLQPLPVGRSFLAALVRAASRSATRDPRDKAGAP